MGDSIALDDLYTVLMGTGTARRMAEFQCAVCLRACRLYEISGVPRRPSVVLTDVRRRLSGSAPTLLRRSRRSTSAGSAVFVIWRRRPHVLP